MIIMKIMYTIGTSFTKLRFFFPQSFSILMVCTDPMNGVYRRCVLSLCCVVRELINAHPDNLATVLKHTIYNELSTARNPNNMAMISLMFQSAPDVAATLLAEIFQGCFCLPSENM
jgi:hypothetical protein